MTALPESAWENDALETLAEPLGWRPAKGEEVAPGTGERDTWDDLLIRPRLLEALPQFGRLRQGLVDQLAGYAKRPDLADGPVSADADAGLSRLTPNAADNAARADCHYGRRPGLYLERAPVDSWTHVPTVGRSGNGPGSAKLHGH